MDENYQDRTGSKLIAPENKLWLPPLSPKDQKRLKHLQKKSLTERMGFSGKTPWDLVQLLLIPLILAGVGYWFTYQQNQTSLQIANDQQRETILKTYLDDMSNLLLNNKLLESKPRDAVRQVARERTLTTLRRLDANRNRTVVQFLQDAHLIGVKNAVVDLSYADLFSDDLRGANLGGANLSDTDLSNADLSVAILWRANLSGAILSDANLSDAALQRANLSGAFLLRANLSKANLEGATGITPEELEKQAKSLKDAIMPDGSKHP